MNKEEIKRIVNEIDYDINTDVYDRWPKLKTQLQYIRGKLSSSLFIINAESLTSYEEEVLKENDYLK